MELYMISGTFIGECYESRRGNDFAGYLIEEEASHELVGVVTINQPSEYDGTRYVFGYKEGNEVAIFQVANRQKVDPVFYIFRDINAPGIQGIFDSTNNPVKKLQVQAKLVKVKDHMDARLKEVEKIFREIRPEGSWGFYEQVCKSDPVAYLKKIKDKLNC